jgi:hypothetical protein
VAQAMDRASASRPEGWSSARTPVSSRSCSRKPRARSRSPRERPSPRRGITSEALHHILVAASEALDRGGGDEEETIATPPRILLLLDVYLTARTKASERFEGVLNTIDTRVRARRVDPDDI